MWSLLLRNTVLMLSPLIIQPAPHHRLQRPHLYHIHTTFTTTPSPPHLHHLPHHHTLTTTPSPLLPHYHTLTTLITIPSPPHPHHHTRTTTTSLPRPHHHTRIPTSSPTHPHHHIPTTTLSPLLLHRHHRRLSHKADRLSHGRVGRAFVSVCRWVRACVYVWDCALTIVCVRKDACVWYACVNA